MAASIECVAARMPQSAGKPFVRGQRQSFNSTGFQRLARKCVSLALVTVVGIAAGALALDARQSRANQMLLLAIQGWNIPALEQWIEAGANVRLHGYEGRTALMLVPDDRPDLALKLLARGAEINARDECGATPLMHIAQLPGSGQVISLLLARGADPNLTDVNGYSALMYAALRHPPATLAELLAAGAHLQGRDHRGATALLWAASAGNSADVQFLLARGVSPQTCDYSGRTASDLSRMREAEQLRGLHAGDVSYGDWVPQLKAAHSQVRKLLAHRPRASRS